MESVGAYEAKTHLPGLLKRVARGEHITITRHGQPVAQLVPVAATTAKPDETIRALRESRRGRTLGELELRDMIEDGRSR
jgi:prevent-host-death family protein